MCIEFDLRKMPYQSEVYIDVAYKGHVIKGQRLDLLVDGQVIVELKCVANLPDVATAQVLSNLRATGLKRALLINFSHSRLADGIKRISL